MCETVGTWASGVPVGVTLGPVGVFVGGLSTAAVELREEVGCDEFSVAGASEDWRSSVVASVGAEEGVDRIGVEDVEDVEESVVKAVEASLVSVSGGVVVGSSAGTCVVLVGVSAGVLFVAGAVDDSSPKVLVPVTVMSNGGVTVSDVVVDSSARVLVGSEAVARGVVTVSGPPVGSGFEVLVVGGKGKTSSAWLVD